MNEHFIITFHSYSNMIKKLAKKYPTPSALLMFISFLCGHKKIMSNFLNNNATRFFSVIAYTTVEALGTHLSDFFGITLFTPTKLII